MKCSYYQLNNYSFRYTRHWYTKQTSRRYYDVVSHIWTGDSVLFEYTPTLGFRVGYEYGYTLGLF